MAMWIWEVGEYARPLGKDTNNTWLWLRQGYLEDHMSKKDLSHKHSGIVLKSSETKTSAKHLLF